MKNTKLLAAILALSSPALVFAQQTDDRKDTGAVQLSDQAMAHLLATGVNVDRPDQPDGTTPSLPSINKQAGGIIAGEKTSVFAKTDNKILVKNNAQQNISTINLVNNAGAMTDNATNIWYGDFKDASIDLVPLTFNSNLLGEQSNVISQTDGNAASVGGYNEYETGMNSTFNSTSHDTANASVTAGNDDMSLLDGLLFESDENIGRGIAASAGADIHVDAGEVTVGGSITTGGSLAWGLLSGETTMEAEVTVELPEIDVEFDGTACAAFEGASCAAGHDSDETKAETETFTSAPIETITNAQASIIAKDGAAINANIDNDIKLVDNAQQNVEAINVINAAGGMVGNGLNIAHTNGMSFIAGSVGTIRQSNVLIQNQ